MNCETAREWMQRHMDHDLDEKETAMMKEHVEQCPACARLLDKLSLLSRGLEQLPRVEPPYSLVDAILPRLEPGEAAALDTSQPAKPSEKVRLKRRTARLARMASMAAIAAALVLVVVNNPFGRGLAPEQEAAHFPQTQLADGMNNDALQIMEIQDQANEAMSATSAGNNEAAADRDAAVMHNNPQMRGESTEDKRSISNEGNGTHESFARSNPPASAEAGDVQGQTPQIEAAAPEPVADQAQQIKTHMGIATLPEAISPDGRWHAIQQGESQHVYRMSDGQLMQEQMIGNDVSVQLMWSDDSRFLYYHLTDAAGLETAGRLQMSE